MIRDGKRVVEMEKSRSMEASPEGKNGEGVGQFYFQLDRSVQETERCIVMELCFLLCAVKMTYYSARHLASINPHFFLFDANSFVLRLPTPICLLAKQAISTFPFFWIPSSSGRSSSRPSHVFTVSQFI